MKLKLTRISPLAFILSAIGIAALSFALRGHFNPFVVFTFAIAAPLELIFRKQSRIPSNLLSLVSAVIVVILIKFCVIDMKKMASDSLEPRIKKGTTIIYRPAFFKINAGDLVIFQNQNDPRGYVGIVKEIRDGTFVVYRNDSDSSFEVERNAIKAKIIYPK